MKKVTAKDLREKLDEAKSTSIDWPEVVKAGHEKAKTLFGDKYDKTKANGVINNMIKNMKDGDPSVKTTKEASGIVCNCFKGK